jgi:hypothetical protein
MRTGDLLHGLEVSDVGITIYKKVVQLLDLSCIEWENYICPKWFIDES